MRTLIHALGRTVRRMRDRRNSTLREEIARDELQFELPKGLV